MKNTKRILLKISLLVCLFASGYQASAQITLSVKNTKMSQIIQLIETKSGYSFFFNADMVDLSKSINFETTNESLDATLTKLFDNTQISFKIKDKQIVLTQKKKIEANPPKGTRRVSGIVYDPKGETIIGATIMDKTSKKGTITDVNGKFSLDVQEQSTITVSYIGYVTTNVKTGSQNSLIITLTEDVKTLDEVVVVGYGTVKKRDLTGSISSIGEKQLSERVFVSAEQALQGLVSGVQVTEVNSEPGGESSIRIRGSNSINSSNEPLFVVDGFVGGNIDGINPSDIQSMEVLKDASATAIYGSRGANGVIIITTKKGNENGLKIEFNSKFGFSKVTKTIDMMNAQEYAQFIQDGAGDILVFTPEQIAAMGEGTNWQDEVLQTGQYSNYQLSMRGGDKQMKYYVSGGYLYQKGNVINSDLDKATLRANLSNKLAKGINLELNAAFSSSTGNRATVNTAGTSQDGATVLNSTRMAPFVPVKDGNGNYTVKNFYPGFEQFSISPIRIIGNPVAYANDAIKGMVNINGNMNAMLTIDLISGAVLKSTLAESISRQENNNYIPKSLYEGSIVGGAGGYSKLNKNSFLTEHTLLFKKDFSRTSRFDVLGGFTYQNNYTNGFSISAQDYFSDTNKGVDISNANVITDYSSSELGTSIMSYLFRTNYIYDEKYLATFSGRADGSSKFAKGHRWGYFPSLALAWNVNKEGWMNRAIWIDQFKIRASAGVTGNQEIPNFSSLFYYQTGQYNFVNGVRIGTLVPENIGNKTLEWEKTLSYNLGLDFAVLNNRITLVADAYYKKTYDMLLIKKIPRSSGFTYATDNIGDVENKGVEISLITRNFASKKRGGFTWETKINYSKNLNKILRLGNNNEDIFVGESTGNMSNIGTTSILRVGEPIGTFYGCMYDGVWRDADQIKASGFLGSAKAGDPRFIDQNKDGYITLDDRVIVGNSYPKFTASISNTINYKGFGLDILLYGSYGGNVFNLNRYYLEGWAQYNKPKYMNDRWTLTNLDSNIPGQSSTLMRNTPGAASVYVEDASFLRIKNLTLSYSFPASLMKKINNIEGIKVFLSGENLHTFTKYSGYDPEVNSFGKSNLSLATDLGSYPKFSTLVFGLSISL
jgi:TonB-linked SusC/RagA family outer membrane protein